MAVRPDPARGEVAQFLVAPPAVCARYRDSTVRCWNIDFAALPPQLDDVEPVLELDAVDTLAGGGDCVCGLRHGDVWCWSVRRSYTCEVTPSQRTTTGDIVQLVETSGLVCALHRSGEVTCLWSEPLPDAAPGATPHAAHVDSPVPFVWLRVVGASAFCGATAENELYCWGASSYFMGLGRNCTLLDDSTPPTELWSHSDHRFVAFPAGVVALDVASAGNVACIITLDGELRCMSSNGALDLSCPLGLQPPFPEQSAAPACAAETPVTAPSWAPVVVPVPAPTRLVIVGESACMASGTTWECCGPGPWDSANGQIPDAGSGRVTPARPRSGGRTWPRVTRWCGRTADDGASCVSTDRGAEIVVRADPVRGAVVQLATYPPTACARYEDRTVRCWDVGLSSPPPLLDDVEVAVELDAVDELVAATTCMCGLRHGDVWCWSARVGHGIYCDMTPSQRTTTGDVVQIVGNGGGFLCALHRSGEVTCLANTDSHDYTHGALARVQSPVPFAWLRVVGNRAFCGATAENELYCWGETSYFMGLRHGCTLLDTGAPRGGLPLPSPWSDLWMAFPAGITALDVASTDDAACIIDLDGNLQCMSGSGVLDPSCPLGLAPPFPERSAAPDCAAEP